MSKFLKFILCVLLFVFSFVLFLYWSFPYEVLKDRAIGSIGADYDISVKELSPYWFTGIDVSGVKVREPAAKGGTDLMDIKRIRGRISILSLLFGKPKVSFDVDIGKGDISGTAMQTEDETNIDVDIDDIDLKYLKVVMAKTGINMTGELNGKVALKVDKKRPIRSEGKIALNLRNVIIPATNVKLGEMSMPLPDLTLTKQKGSDIKLEISKGTISVDTFTLVGGDLEIDLKGKIFLSNNINNYRFNLNGSLKASEVLNQALPFLFVVEKQKREDGSFPLSITGRLAKPSIKVGTFTLPM